MSAVEFTLVSRAAHIGGESQLTELLRSKAPLVLLIAVVLVASIVLATATGTDYGDAAFLLG
jgi:hypothetical protein